MIGVFGYQGGAHLHIQALNRLGIPCKQVYYFDDLDVLDGLILPGGESSVQYQYLRHYECLAKIIRFSQTNKPILGTCAGMILLSHFCSQQVRGLKLIDVDVKRNIYGSQFHSGIKQSDKGNLCMFIRAPGVTRVGKQVTILDHYQKRPIFVKQHCIYGATFHPELMATNQSNILSTIFGS